MSNASPSNQLVWLITGTSSGLGRELAIAALNRGDKVIATTRARSLSQLDDLKAKGAEVIELDVTASPETLKTIAAKAVGIYGRVDVLVNNAGYVLVGALEENTAEETFQQFNTSVFGALNTTRSFLPYMRERKSGTVVFIGSLVGWTGIPNCGIYAASKFAIRGIAMTLHDEIAPLGLRSVCIDPGQFRTAFLAAENRSPWIPRIDAYRPMSANVEAIFNASHGNQPGNPVKAGEVIVDVVRGEGCAKDKTFPKLLALGTDCYTGIKRTLENDMRNYEEWKDISRSTDFELQ